MITKLFNSIFRADGHESLRTPPDVDASFHLLIDDLLVGHLQLSNGLWKFSYSDEFKGQEEHIPIVNFPRKDRIYESKELWPFFLGRIPGLDQPSIRATLTKENIKDDDEIGLLRRFGKRTISNPFILTSA